MDIKELAKLILDNGYSAALLNEAIDKEKKEREAERLKQEANTLKAKDKLIEAAFNYAYVAGLATQEELDDVDLDKVYKYLDSIEKSVSALKKMKIKINPVEMDRDLDIIKRFVEGI